MHKNINIRQEAQVEFFDVLICSSLIPGCLYWYVLGSDGTPFIYGDVDCKMEEIQQDTYVDVVKEAIAEELGIEVQEIRTINDDLKNTSLNNKQLLSWAI